MALKLKVPSKDMDLAQSKGAVWDENLKSWLICKDKDYNDFVNWIPDDGFSVIAHSPFYVAINFTNCWNCFKKTTMIALASDNFLIRHQYKGHRGKICNSWTQKQYFTFFSSPRSINEETLDIVAPKFPFFKFGYSKCIPEHYWANHCEHCNAFQGDFFSHGKPGASFCPTSKEQCKRITLMQVPAKVDMTLCAQHSIGNLSEMIIRHTSKRSWNT